MIAPRTQVADKRQTTAPNRVSTLLATFVYRPPCRITAPIVAHLASVMNTRIKRGRMRHGGYAMFHISAITRPADIPRAFYDRASNTSTAAARCKKLRQRSSGRTSPARASRCIRCMCMNRTDLTARVSYLVSPVSSYELAEPRENLIVTSDWTTDGFRSNGKIDSRVIARNVGARATLFCFGKWRNSPKKLEFRCLCFVN